VRPSFAEIIDMLPSIFLACMIPSEVRASAFFRVFDVVDRERRTPSFATSLSRNTGNVGRQAVLEVELFQGRPVPARSRLGLVRRGMRDATAVVLLFCRRREFSFFCRRLRNISRCLYDVFFFFFFKEILEMEFFISVVGSQRFANALLQGI
jgi:hypothetical protein